MRTTIDHVIPSVSEACRGLRAEFPAKDVVAEFAAKGFDPEAYTLYSYAAVQIIKQAAEKAKSLDPQKVAEVMHSGMPFHTVLGDISYDKKGDRTNVDYVDGAL